MSRLITLASFRNGHRKKPRLSPGGGPMDAFDALCIHHEHAASGYPTGQNDPFDPCVIGYGLAFARVSRHGDVIEPGSAVYDEIMARMSNLRDAIEGYAAYAMSCPPELLGEFIEVTRADHSTSST